MDRFEFRPATEEELPQLRQLGAYVFAAEGAEDAEEATLRPEWTHAAFHRGRLVASSGGYPFKLRMNGRGVFADGVTAVGTDPGYRRRGLVRRLIEDRLRMARERGQPVAILWASMAAIYQRFGYGLASTQVEYAFDPRFAALQFGPPASGYARRLAAEEAVPVISQLYRAFIEPRNLLVHRAPVMWELPFRRLEGAKTPATHCAVHYDDAHVPDGYLLYSMRTLAEPGSDPIPDQELAIRDFVWRDMNGYRGLWAFLRSHDLVGKVTTARVPEDDPALSLLLEPRVLQRRTSDGIWLRVVDAALALAERGYDCAGETTIAIAEDPQCPWNVGAFRLATDAVQAEAVRCPGSAAAEITATPAALASLLAGHTPLSTLVRVGRAEVRDDKRLPALDALFSTRYRPYCMDGF